MDLTAAERVRQCKIELVQWRKLLDNVDPYALAEILAKDRGSAFVSDDLPHAHALE
jgi:hypothetical protein